MKEHPMKAYGSSFNEKCTGRGKKWRIIVVTEALRDTQPVRLMILNYLNQLILIGERLFSPASFIGKLWEQWLWAHLNFLSGGPNLQCSLAQLLLTSHATAIPIKQKGSRLRKWMVWWMSGGQQCWYDSLFCLLDRKLRWGKWKYVGMR